MSKLFITFICENKHELEMVSMDVNLFGNITDEKIWRLLSNKNSRCKICGSRVFTYRTRYKD